MKFVPFVPAWLEEHLLEVHNTRASHVFLISGNVKDYVPMGGGFLPLEEMLTSLGAQRPIVFSYSLATGFRFPDRNRELAFRRAAQLDGRSALPAQPQAVTQILDRVFRSARTGRRSVLGLFPYVDTIAPSGGSSYQSQEERSIITSFVRWADDAAVAEKALIILLSENLSDVAEPLRTSQSGLHGLSIPRPDSAVRESFARHFLEQRQRASDGEAVQQIATRSQGLSLRQLEDILLRQRDLNDLTAIQNKKIEILTQEYGDVLQIIESKYGLEAVGGLDYAVRELQEVAEIMKKEITSAAPMGIMLLGPPGTGKSYLAECFAKECGLLCVRFKPLRQMYVGASERNQERAFTAIRALAPVVVIVDESDQEEPARGSGASGDSGVSERMRGHAFQFWGDQSLRGKVLRIDITNRVDLIDPAMRRSGRTDIKIPILMPDAEARRQIMTVIVKKHRFVTAVTDFTQIAARTEGFAGADLELLATTAFRFASRRETREITQAEWDAALDDFIPSARDAAAIDRMTLLALDECRSKRLLPRRVEDLRAEILKRRTTTT